MAQNIYKNKILGHRGEKNVQPICGGKGQIERLLELENLPPKKVDHNL